MSCPEFVGNEKQDFSNIFENMNSILSAKNKQQMYSTKWMILIIKDYLWQIDHFLFILFFLSFVNFLRQVTLMRKFLISPSKTTSQMVQLLSNSPLSTVCQYGVELILLCFCMCPLVLEKIIVYARASRYVQYIYTRHICVSVQSQDLDF